MIFLGPEDTRRSKPPFFYHIGPSREKPHTHPHPDFPDSLGTGGNGRLGFNGPPARRIMVKEVKREGEVPSMNKPLLIVLCGLILMVFGAVLLGGLALWLG